MTSSKSNFTRILILLAIILTQFTGPQIARAGGTVGTGTATSCTEAALNTALTGGGSVNFNCGAAPVTITITSTKIISASTQIDGGGLITISGGNSVQIFDIQSSSTLSLTTITISNGNSGTANGGAIHINSGSTAIITNSTFSNNTNSATVFPNGGGAIFNEGILNISGSTFSLNSATGFDGDGGAIESFGAGSSVNITNTTFFGNTAGVNPFTNSVGGAINVRDSNGINTITHVTLSNNTNEAPYGALDVVNSSATLSNSILANSVTGFDCSKRFSGTLTSTNNLIENDSTTDPCSTAITSDPGLGALQNNGGPTQTMAITAASPAFNFTATCPLTVDQRGVSRPQPSGGNCDLGAYELDTPPTVTIDQAAGQPDPTNASPINFTVVFSEPVTGFATGDVSFTGSTVGGALTGTVTGGPTTFNVAVTGMTTPGTVVASIAAGVATDTALNNNTASTSTDNTVTFDATGPPVTINQAVGQLDPTSTSPINFTVVFSEATTNFATGDVTLSGTAGATTATVTEIAPNDGTTYNVAVSGMTGDGTVIVTIAVGVATDALGNGNSASTSTDNTVTYDTTGPIVAIGAPSVAITTTGPVDFPITITGATTFNLTVADVTLNTTGTATGTVSVTNGGTANPTVTISGTTGSGTIGISIAAGVASDASANTSPAAGPSATFIVDNGGPVVTASAPANGTSVPGPNQLTVTFNEDVSAATGNNVANYLLLNDGGDGFDDAPTVTTCLTGSNPNGGNDLNIPINSAAYTNNGGGGPFVSTLGINGGVALPVGTYRLYVCGTTSIEDLVGNELNNGLNDTIINFTVIIAAPGGGGAGGGTLIPTTGFPKGEVTSVGIQPADKAYKATDMWIEIPTLNVRMSIVGVPQTKDGWDVKWLGRDAGWLNGSAFPTWSGNSVITGHVWDALNKSGPFSSLKDLKYGDQLKIHAFGQLFTYEIRESSLISPKNTSSMLKHEEISWLTLITCETFNEKSQSYTYRRMVRAVLVSVTMEK